MGDENRLFRQFEANLRMTPATVSAVRNRYHAITRRINVDFWGTSSDTDHSWYAGSYGRGTAISTSDIDILVELPPGEYNNAWARSLFGGNGPSELLQKVKRSLSATYPQTKLRGDGQVVVAEFTDGVRFEIVPVFRAETPGTYRYPDTHDGGSGPTMNPRRELEVFNGLSKDHPGGLKKFCRMLRAWNKQGQYFSGQALDAMAFEYWEQSQWADNLPYLYFDWHTRDFFEYWKNEFARGGVVVAPGTRRRIDTFAPPPMVDLLALYADNAKTAIDATDTCQATEFWRLIFDDRFPKS